MKRRRDVQGLYQHREHWPQIQRALHEQPATIRELSERVGLHHENAKGYVRRMLRERLIYVQTHGTGPRPHVYAARTPA